MLVFPEPYLLGIRVLSVCLYLSKVKVDGRPGQVLSERLCQCLDFHL